MDTLRDVCVIWKSKENRWVTGNVTNVNDGIEVTWNSGKIDQFKEDTDSLLVYDISPAGICHETVTCDGCKTKRIIGSRWTCAECFDYDLCNICYHSDQHNTEHTFKRIDIPKTKGVVLGKRSNSDKGKIYGFFSGAKVKRGRDWEWGNQDGGAGNIGTVTSMYDWKSPFDQDVRKNGASVQWGRGRQESNYRIGFKGKVDLLCENPALGGSFYPSHLPTTKFLMSLSQKKNSKNFNVEDLVVVCKKLEIIAEAQECHGGFTKEMASSIGIVGKIIGIMDGSVIVSFDLLEKPRDLVLLLMDVQVKQNKRWLFNPSLLQKVDELKANSKVRVIDDLDTFKVMQMNIGNYHPSQDVLIGKEVTILKNDQNKLTVRYGDGDVYMSCGAVRKREKEEDELIGLLLEGFMRCAIDEREKAQKTKEEKEKEKLERGRRQNGQRSVPDGGARKRVQPREYGLRELVEMHDADGVRKLLNDRPHMVNLQQQGSTCLHVAVFNNDEEIVDIFLEKNADLSIPDDNGDTLLHIAAAKNYLVIGRKLAKKKCPLNEVNKSGLTPVGVAILKSHVEFVRMLVVGWNCRTDIRDPNGDIPLHTAAIRGDNSLVDILLKKEDINTPNSVGLCAVHLAMSEHNKDIIVMIVDKFPQTLNSVIADGATLLHVAVRRGNEDMVEFILGLMMKYQRKVTPNPDIDQRTKSDQTALQIACLEGFLAIVKQLLHYGASIDAETQNGMTAVSMCVMKHQLLRLLPQQLKQSQEETPDLRTVRSHFQNIQSTGIVMACFLLENGANINHYNHEGKTVLDLCEDNTVKRLLCEFSKKQVQVDALQATAVPLSLFNQTALNSNQPATETNPQPFTKPKQSQATNKPKPLFATKPKPPVAIKPKPPVAIKPKPPAATKPKPPAAIEKQQSELDYDPCPLCKSRAPIEGRFKPCGHALFCYDHANSFKHCPTCKVTVESLTRLSIERLPDCRICCNNQVNMTFQPCGHQIVCYICSHRIKVCLICEQNIRLKVPIGEIIPPTPKPRPRPAPRPPSMATSPTTSQSSNMPEETNEEMICNICMEHRRNLAFQCGHTCCKICGENIQECHMCRVKITHRFNIFF